MQILLSTGWLAVMLSVCSVAGAQQSSEPAGPEFNPQRIEFLENRMKQIESRQREAETGIQRLESRIQGLDSQVRQELVDRGDGAAGFVIFLFGVFCALWAQNTGRSPWLWFFMGLFFNIITVLVLLSKNASDKKAEFRTSKLPT